jgi:hypothetical protein
LDYQDYADTANDVDTQNYHRYGEQSPTREPEGPDEQHDRQDEKDILTRNSRVPSIQISDSENEGSTDSSSTSSLMHTHHFPSPHPLPEEWPLATARPVRNALESFQAANDVWFVRIILLIIGFLHAKHHMSFRACGILLWCLRSIFIVIGLLSIDNHMPTTLGTTFTHLGLVDRFTLLLVCPQCRAVCGRPITSPKLEEELLCAHCETMLYSGIPTSYLRLDPATRPTLKKGIKPKIVVPFASLKDLLAELLARPGNEGLIDAWRTQRTSAAKYGAIWDGHIWKTIRDANDDFFFAARGDNELRIAATCGLDW